MEGLPERGWGKGPMELPGNQRRVRLRQRRQGDQVRALGGLGQGHGGSGGAGAQGEGRLSTADKSRRRSCAFCKEMTTPGLRRAILLHSGRQKPHRRGFTRGPENCESWV